MGSERSNTCSIELRATDARRISVCGRRLLQLLRVRQLLRVLSPCCVAAAVAERVSYGCVDIWMCKSIALKLSARCVPPRDAAQHQPRGCCAQQLRSNYQADNRADYFGSNYQADTSLLSG